MVRWLWVVWVAAVWTMALPAAAAVPAVARLVLDGPIGPASAEYFDNASKRAVDDGAVAIVLQVDTPGGLAESMRQIIARMLACKVPVLVYVAPDGARAASAGTYIVYAGQIAAMAPATHLGAATPVALGGSTPMPMPAPVPKTGNKPDQPATPESADSGNGDAESHKILNDSISYIRSLAQLRGRNAEWAEQAVRGAATLTATEAVQQHVVDFVATDLPDLLAKADGREVSVGNHTVTLHLVGLAVRDYKPDARIRFLAIITNPTTAYLLLVAGIVGLLLEATHPGALLPGIAGAISLLAGLYALQLLPVNYAGLALMVLGIGLLLAEALHPTVGALGIGGVIAFVLGSVMLMDTAVPGYSINIGVIAGIAVGVAVSLGMLLWLVFRARRSRKVTGDEAMLHEVAELLEPLEAGGEAWAQVLGERWRVRSDTALPTGARVRIVQRQGLILRVAPL